MMKEVFESIPYVHQHQIHWGDTDAAGIVYTVRFVDFAMQAIETAFGTITGISWYRLNNEQRLGTPFNRIEMDIKAPLTPEHQLASTVRITRLGASAIDFQVEGRRSDGVLSYQARFSCCIADTETLKPVPMPEAMRETINRYRTAVGQAEW